MRLIAWNCCEKFSSNYAHLRELNFDVAVVAERTRITADALQVRGLTSSYVQPLVGAPKLLGVFAQEPWRVTAHTEIQPTAGLLPMTVTGPTSFTLLGFWGVEPKLFGSYTSQARRVIDDVLPKLAGPVVLAGDFNAPIATTAAAHTENVRLLEERGLVSAFTATRAMGAPLEPTYYRWLRREHPFHIDHAFVPKEWASRLSMTVGSYDDWVLPRRSDHVPLIVDVTPAA
ncbi:endonuclease/exonuclease/phosphatase family protein [Nocardioides kribbensis]|uniref:endonuclease/exonuclease/phosphatase family protein n=1 Tax=Nocardioides kribbensis TaxID=305517 RepID=UPI00187A4637|nr:endonuclease/exonuclease/phosphatase family protein [Nocardioides kribbensis]